MGTKQVKWVFEEEKEGACWTMKPSKRQMCFNWWFEQFYWFKGWIQEEMFDLQYASLWHVLCCFADGMWNENHLYSGRTWYWKYNSSICGVCVLLLRDHSFDSEGANSITALFILVVRNHCLRHIRSLHTDVFELCRFYCFYFKYLFPGP